jgi:hypothetical protein
MTITKEGLVITRDNKTLGTFVSVDDFAERADSLNLGGERVAMSSSLDWPEEQTDDINIIELADMIRGNNVSGRNPEFNSF